MDAAGGNNSKTMEGNTKEAYSKKIKKQKYKKILNLIKMEK